MVGITLNIDLDDVIDEIDDLFKKQIPYSSFLALNETVYKASVGVKKDMPYFIQGGPVPFTKRGVQYKKAASKRDLVAHVFIPDDQWKYMKWVIDGGVKRSGGSKTAPGVPVNARLNKYGNIPGRHRKAALWHELAKRGKGTVATPIKGALGKNEFVGEVNGIMGLWKRLGSDGRSKLKLLVSFDRDPIRYKKRFPFARFVIKHAHKNFKTSFNRKLTQVVNRESKKLKVV